MLTQNGRCSVKFVTNLCVVLIFVVNIQLRKKKIAIGFSLDSPSQVQRINQSIISDHSEGLRHMIFPLNDSLQPVHNGRSASFLELIFITIIHSEIQHSNEPSMFVLRRLEMGLLNRYQAMCVVKLLDRSERK